MRVIEAVGLLVTGAFCGVAPRLVLNALVPPAVHQQASSVTSFAEDGAPLGLGVTIVRVPLGFGADVYLDNGKFAGTSINGPAVIKVHPAPVPTPAVGEQ